MGTSAGPTHKQDESSSQPVQAMSATNEPTIQEIKGFDEVNLLKWIRENLSLRLKPEAERKFLDAEIDGESFLSHAGDDAFFQKAGLTLGVSDKLARLAEKTLDRKSECICLHYTPPTDSQLRTSQETANKLGLRRRPTPRSKEGLQTAKLILCSN